MSKFYGNVGFAILTEEKPDVWIEKIVERPYYGDLTRNSRRLESGDKVNSDIRISNNFSIVADPYAYENFHAIRYVVFMGVKWKVESADASSPPRLNLEAGSVYNN